MTWTPEEFAHEIGAFRRELRGIARKMGITLTDGGVWQTLGHATFDVARPETRSVEVYPGIGVYARPPAGDSPEGIVIQVGGTNNPALVATRDESTRAAAVGDTAADESNLYNSKARVHVKAGGTVEIVGVPAVLAAEKMPRFETYRTAEDTLNTATSVLLEALAAIFGLLAAATPTLTGSPAAIAAFNAAVTPAALTALTGPYADALTAFTGAAATYLARVGKVE